ncbi:UNVERIFIED_CONTAM: hypothetical protein FKN15_035228, partial [Acipenser sinensis]
TIIKEGMLMKQTNSFQRWKKRYFKLRGRTLYYAKTAKSVIFDEVDLTDASVAESSTKNVNNSFTSTQYSMDHFSGMHNWYACSHARPTYCNVCREALSGVTSHGLSCEVCKFKAHKRCAIRATNNCKWTTLASIGKDIIEDEDGISMPHQWLEGNLPVSAKCTVCDKTCGSVLRLQDWRCLWCKAMIHTACKELLSSKCPLGQCKVSVIPPTALNSIDSDGFWKASCPPSCTSPLLVFVNSKSGDNQGVKFLRRFKQLLNPAQVFDLMNRGPHLGLRLFQKFDTFRILVCGGDGSVGWVLSEIDTLTLHKQCQLGVLPLGTGNDLARVLGWGSACDDDTQLPQILEKLERASTKMLDRWSIMVYETKLPRQHSSSTVTEDYSEDSEVQQILTYEDSVAAHLSKILTSDQHSVVISSANPLLVFVNSKSGDNQGVKFLRRFKQLLNPAQVFDLMNGGPHLGLRLFQKFDTFRILVCGGDGSVGWVLSEIDTLTLHKQCQLGVLPLGTGNDLARVLGWGSACDDDTQLPQILEKLERASTKMLDRWSIMVYETKLPRQHSSSTVTEDYSEDSECQLGVLPLGTGNDLARVLGWGSACDDDTQLPQILEKLERASTKMLDRWSIMVYETKLPRQHSSSTVTEDYSEDSEVQQILTYEDSVAAHLSKILTSDQHSVVISSAKSSSSSDACMKVWCVLIHTACKELLSSKCPLGQCKVSVIPPTALNSIDSDGFWKASCPPSCTSPLLVFVNSKSGDNQGVKFLRRFKQLLNPAQVFDLMNGGPHLGLRLFQKFDTFRILVCGGDGSVGWVLSEIDTLTLHKQCQLGVLPLGTGNDLARVLGWGSACDDDTQLPQILEKLERASTKMLDSPNHSGEHGHSDNRRRRLCLSLWQCGVLKEKLDSLLKFDYCDCSVPLFKVQQILTYEDSVAAHLSKILTSDQHSVVISSAKSSSSSDACMKVWCMLVCDLYHSVCQAVDEQNAQTQEQEVFALGTSLEEEEGRSEDKVSLQSSHSGNNSCVNAKGRGARKVSKSPCEKLISKGSLSLGSSSSLPAQTGNRDNMPMLSTKILYSSLRASLSGSLPGSSVIGRLLVNADPFNYDPESHDCYTEKCVMNNYFGIGLDAKISLDFNNKRDEHPEKCRSRTKNMMWYGVLGTKELLHRTYKNLEQKVLLECGVLKEKLDSLLKTLNEESQASSCLPNPPPTIAEEQEEGEGLGLQEPPVERHAPPAPCPPRTNPGIFKPREQLMLRANSLKKAIRQIIEHTEKAVDEQNAQTQEQEVFALGTSLEEEEGRSEDKVSLQSSHSGNNSCVNAKGRGARKGSFGVVCDITQGHLKRYVILHRTFTAPSFDDKILEVVAVFGSMQMAVSRVINLQHHRIAQCRTVKITVLGEEGVPVQVDGEAWVQPPGYIRIIHKNRTPTLTRDRADPLPGPGNELSGQPFQILLLLFFSALTGREEDLSPELIILLSQSPIGDETHCQGDILEAVARHTSILGVPEWLTGRSTAMCIREIAQSHQRMEQELAHAVNASSKSMDVVYAKSKNTESHQRMEQELAHAVNASSKSMDVVYAKSKNTEGLNCSVVFEMVNNVKALHNETELLLAGKMCLQLDPPQKEQLCSALGNVDLQLRKLTDISWLCQLVEPSDEESHMMELSKPSRSAKFRLVPKFKKEKNNKNKEASGSLTFTAPSFDDKILEVVAVFGSMQMAVSRVINLQHHRIAQADGCVACDQPPAPPYRTGKCRTVKITVLGEEGVPVQVDGEAWVQPPGYIRIIHKNRTPTLTRDRQLDPPQKEQLCSALGNVDLQLRKLTDISWLCQLVEPSDEESHMMELSKPSRSAKFRLVPKFKKEKNNKNKEASGSLAFENTLKSWEDKQKCEFPRPSAQLALLPEIVSEEEASQINLFGQSAGALIHSIREIAQSHQRMEQELAHAVNASSKSMDVVYAKSKNTEVQVEKAEKPELNEPRFMPWVTGGEKGKKGQSPWQALILNAMGRFHCGGVLIDHSWVLTAAHCVHDGTKFSVRLGDYERRRIEDTEITIPVSEIVRHAEHDRVTADNDIALLRLQTPVTYTKFIVPVCLPQRNLAEQVLMRNGTKVTVTGWGRERENSTSYSSALNFIEIPLAPQEQCAELMLNQLTDNMLCAGVLGGSKDACSGDSGGPMVTNFKRYWFLVGLVSWGEGCGRMDKLGVYTKVSSYLEWIENVRMEKKSRV